MFLSTWVLQHHEYNSKLFTNIISGPCVETNTLIWTQGDSNQLKEYYIKSKCIIFTQTVTCYNHHNILDRNHWDIKSRVGQADEIQIENRS